MENIEQHAYTRNGKRQIDYFGYNSDGKPIVWTDHLDPDENISQGNALRESPDVITIRFRKDEQGRGVLTEIETDYGGFVVLGANGKILLVTAHKRKMKANSQDLLDFAAMLWGKAKAFIRNGRVRNILGANYMPVAMLDASGNAVSIPDAYYDGGGRVVDGVVYTTQSAAVGNYDTHRVDGTPIYPEPDDTL